MKVADFSYELPPELIAQYPAAERTASRLLYLAADGRLADLQFTGIVDYLNEGDLLVLNDTRVIPARIFGRKETGGQIEIVLERILDEHRFLAQIRASKSPKPGQRLFVDEDSSAELEVVGRQESFFELSAQVDGSLIEWFERIGHMPLPPYIERSDERLDADRYQTVYGQRPGAVAAPTAGLHYTDELLEKLRQKGVQIKTLTLHVGAGTYQPVRVDTIEEHTMHAEYIEVPEDVCAAVMETKKQGNRVCAAGTTVVRSLETAAANSSDQLIEPYFGETDIFIYPGYRFAVVDVLQTNFHLPESTLLMLVSAFAGKEAIMRSYRHAIEQQYRFFSYGDAMLIERADNF